MNGPSSMKVLVDRPWFGEEPLPVTDRQKEALGGGLEDAAPARLTGLDKPA
jgi:hypothetical protein